MSDFAAKSCRSREGNSGGKAAIESYLWLSCNIFSLTSNLPEIFPRRIKIVKYSPLHRVLSHGRCGRGILLQSLARLWIKNRPLAAGWIVPSFLDAHQSPGSSKCLKSQAG
jgi:hypothetical protein